jgi:hypothetical protein
MKALSPLLLALLFSVSSGADLNDKVTSLPEMGEYTFNVYSGYLGIPNSSKNLHYMFVES